MQGIAIESVANSAPASLRYRPEIDGLRALAVLGVVFYHVDPTGLGVPGGFSGVDVFFVISGFLITQILVKTASEAPLAQASQNAPWGRLWAFYVRRFRRIFPALLVMIGATLCLGYYWLIPDDYASLGASARYALFALSNWFFLNNTGYFDQAAELLPLLHTWSLAIEEQFYLVWPILLIGLAQISKTLSSKVTGSKVTGSKANNNKRTLIIVVVTLIILCSLVYAELLVKTDAKTAFYDPFARAWELGLGGLIALIPTVRIAKFTAELIDAAGLALIGYSLFALDDNMTFPGINALYACLGAALIVLPKSTTLAGRLLALPPLRATGLISYSLYLWHWPILVFALHLTASELTISQAWTVVVLSFLAATLSWKFVEQPFRKPSQHKKLHGALATGMVLVLCGGATVIYTTNGMKSRLPETALALSDRDAMWDWQPEETKQLGGFKTFGANWRDAKTRYVLWGDSHAQHYGPLMETVLTDFPQTSMALYHGCAANVDGVTTQMKSKDTKYNNFCEKKRRSLIRFLQTESVDAVVLASPWAAQVRMLEPHAPQEVGLMVLRQSLESTLDELAELVPKVTILGQVPPWRVDPLPCALAYVAGIHNGRCDGNPPSIAVNELYESHFLVDAMLLNIATARPAVMAYPVTNLLCDDTRCRTYIGDQFLYMDASHIRRNLTTAVRAELAEILQLNRVFSEHPTLADRPR